MVEGWSTRGRLAAARIAARAQSTEKHVIAALLATVFGIYVFAEIADEAMEGGAHAFDTWLLLAFRSSTDLADPIGPPWFEAVVRDCTALGSPVVLAILTIGVTGFLLATSRRRAAVTILLSVLGGMVLSESLKLGFARPRPDVVPHGMQAYSQSFPSGHAMMSATVYLTLGMLLARTESSRRAKLFSLAYGALLAVIVGLSRIYLGVHWPTDVLAGWAGGAAWALTMWLVMYWLQRRGKVESSDATSTGALRAGAAPHT
jgi:undecaprenyl-diphosphatase